MSSLMTLEVCKEMVCSCVDIMNIWKGDGLASVGMKVFVQLKIPAFHFVICQ